MSRRRNSDLGVRIDFIDPLDRRREAQRIGKRIQRIASDPANWHISALGGEPYLIDPKTDQTISGIKCPPHIVRNLKGKRNRQKM